MKKTTIIALGTILMLTSGCDYSSSSTSKSSFSVSSNGNVETKTSSTVYTERVENGKTVNNSATVLVTNKGASVNTEKLSVKESKAGLSYMADDADLRKGEAEIDGYFINSGKNTVKISKVFLTLTFKNEKGNIIWQDNTTINNLNIVVRPGEKTESNFIITNPNVPAYNGSFDMDYQIEYE